LDARFNEPILLVLEDENGLEEIVRLFVRTGYSKFAGYLVGGMKAWEAAGFEQAEIRQMGVHELNKRAASLQIVDDVLRANGRMGMCRCASHFSAELRSGWGNSTAQSRLRFIARAATAPASLQAF